MPKLNGFRQLNGLKLLITAMTFLVVVVAGSTVSADIVIDNQLIPSGDITSITISPTTGQINIATKTGYTVSKNGSTPPPTGGTVKINTLVANTSNVIQGGSVTLSWSTTEAVSCTASGGFGGWENSAIGLPSGNKVLTSPFIASGDFTFSLTCLGAAGNSDTETTVVKVSSSGPPSGDAAEINSFTSSSSQIDPGGSVLVSWSTTNASSCAAIDGFGGWGGISISLPSGSKSFTGFNQGAFKFTLSCKSAAGATVSKSINVTVGNATKPPPDPPPSDNPPPTNGELAILSFDSSATNVAPNQSFTLSWSTVNAKSCKGLDGGDGWARPLDVSGNMSISLSRTKNYIFTLRCEDAAGKAKTKKLEVEVSTSTPPPQECSPSTSLSRSASPVDWRAFWASGSKSGSIHTFPAPFTADIARLNVGECGYNYISFNTGDAFGSGNILLIPTTTSSGLRLGAISTVPGNFSVANTCKAYWGLGNWIAYTTSGRQGLCQLLADTTYYLNFTFTDGTDASTSSCNSPVKDANGRPRCEIEMQAKFVRE